MKLDAKEESRNKNYKYKYIGETSRSGYERGREHWDMKEKYNEKSHMLKHCLLQHSELEPEKVRFGMRVRQQFKTALERQVGEAVAILEEKEKGIELLNSKSEFNRCSLPRITAGDKKELLETLMEEDAAEKEVKASIRCLKKRKNREKEKKKEESETNLEELCEEIIEENKSKWKRRKLDEEARKKLEEEEIEKLVRENREREERLRKAKIRKEEFLARLARKKEIVIIEKGKDKNWIKRKQKQWREYRVKEEIDSEEEKEMFNKLIMKIPERRRRSSGGEGKTVPLNPFTPLISHLGIESGIMEGGEGGK